MLLCVASLDPEVNMKGCEDFIMIILHARVTSAAKMLLSEKSYDSVMDLAKAILENYYQLQSIREGLQG